MRLSIYLIESKIKIYLTAKIINLPYIPSFLNHNAVIDTCTILSISP